MAEGDQQSAQPDSAPVPVDGTFRLRISDDQLAVYLEDIRPPLYGGTAVSLEDVHDALAKREICYGIDNDKILQRLAASADAAPNSPQHASAEGACIARGKAPIAGQDGRIVWQIEEEHVDQGHFLVNFGELIGAYNAATPGMPGTNVYGKEIAATPGHNDFPRVGAGVETIKSAKGDEYRAKDLGLVRFEEDEGFRLLFIDPRIDVSEDGMEARMALFARSSEGSTIEAADVMAALEVNGIKHGIDEAAIEAGLKDAAARETGQPLDSAQQLVVARGTPPQQGKEARLIISREDSAGAELSGGRIDFHERDYPWNVRKGETIGTLLEAKPAVDGIIVYGESIEVEQPKDIDLELEGLQLDEQGTLTADMDGALVFDGKHMSVVELLVINGDVAKETGNVHSNIPVHVKGYVEAGFVLESKKDVIVDKTVEDATITAGGTILIKGGIRGRKSKIYAPGDITVGFIENATVFVKGDLTVNSSIINSTVTCNGAVVVGSTHAKKSLMSGGELIAHQSIEAVSLGSPAYAKTVVKLGVDLEERKRISGVDKAITARQEKIGTLSQIEYHHKHARRPDTEEVLRKVALTRATLRAEIASLTAQKDTILAKVKEAESVRVMVKRTVYPGVVVEINESSYSVTSELSGVVFLYNADNDKVIVEACT